VFLLTIRCTLYQWDTSVACVDTVTHVNQGLSVIFHFTPRIARGSYT